MHVLMEAHNSQYSMDGNNSPNRERKIKNWSNIHPLVVLLILIKWRAVQSKWERWTSQRTDENRTDNEHLECTCCGVCLCVQYLWIIYMICNGPVISTNNSQFSIEYSIFLIGLQYSSVNYPLLTPLSILMLLLFAFVHLNYSFSFGCRNCHLRIQLNF